MKEKATIYDLWRICKNHNADCGDCPLSVCRCIISAETSLEEFCEMNKMILDWCKEHPVKTRQNKFLEMFPNVVICDGLIDICPKDIDQTFECNSSTTLCKDCQKSYWLAEVEDDE